MRLLNALNRNKDFLKDNIYLMIGTLIVGIAGYAFHFFMGRALGPGDYGKLGVIISINYLTSIIFQIIQHSMSRIVADNHNQTTIGNAELAYAKKAMVFGFILFLSFLVTSPLIADILNMEATIIMLASPLVLFSFILPFARGIMQGKRKFMRLSLNLSTEGITKFIAGIILVLLGFGIYGATSAISLAIIIPTLTASLLILKIFKTKHKSKEKPEILKYIFPTAITIATIVSLYSLDILIVKRFFNDTLVGFYTALTIFGGVILFTSIPFVQVMFARISSNGNKKDIQELKKTTFMLILLTGFITLCYNIFPNLIVSLLYGSDYLQIANLLAKIGITTMLLSGIYLLSFFNLALRKKNILPVLILACITHAITLIIYHPSLSQVIISRSIIFGITAIILLILTRKNLTK